MTSGLIGTGRAGRPGPPRPAAAGAAHRADGERAPEPTAGRRLECWIDALGERAARRRSHVCQLMCDTWSRKWSSGPRPLAFDLRTGWVVVRRITWVSPS